MKAPFREAREALNLVRREYTSVGSLNVMAANAANQACENSLRSLYEVATGQPFPYEEFKPFHKAELIADRLGIKEHYSKESQLFLQQLTGYALDDARFEGTQAYIDHTKASAQNRAKDILKGSERFVEESEQLSKNEEVLNVIRNSQGK
jgi:hypothetical protein